MIPKLKHHVPLRRLGTEAEVSAVICFLLSPGAAFVTGITVPIDGGAPLGSPVFPMGDYPASTGLRRLPPRRDASGPEGRVAPCPSCPPHSIRAPRAFAPTSSACRNASPRCAHWSRRCATSRPPSARRFEKRGQILPRERVAPPARPRQRLPRTLESCRPRHARRRRARRPCSAAAPSSASAKSPASGCVCWPATARSRAARCRRWVSRRPCARRRSPARQPPAMVYLVESGGAN